MRKCLMVTAVMLVTYAPRVYAALGDIFSGRYTVLQGGCTAGAIQTGDSTIEVHADSRGIAIGKILWHGDGSPGHGPFFEAIYTYVVGSETLHCLGACSSTFTGGYSADGSRFSVRRTTTSSSGAAPVFIGTTEFKMSGDTLEIANTITNGNRRQPGSLSVCKLKKQ